LAPSIGLVDVGFMKYSLVADHYQHIAVVGVIVLAAAGWSVWRRGSHGALRHSAGVAAALLVGVLALLTWRQNTFYLDAEQIYRMTLEKNPDCWLVQTNLGMIVGNKGDLPEAIRLFKAVVHAQPKFANGRYNLGKALKDSGRLPEAIEQFQQAVRLNPRDLEAHNDLGKALRDTGRLPEAIEQFHLVLGLNPNDLQAHNELGVALARAGRTAESLQQFEEIRRLKPDDPKIAFKLAQVYANTGRPTDARTTAQQALSLARAAGQTALVQEIERWLKSQP
jgi:protein O-mannosyl-transferase